MIIQEMDQFPFSGGAFGFSVHFQTEIFMKSSATTVLSK